MTRIPVGSAVAVLVAAAIAAVALQDRPEGVPVELQAVSGTVSMLIGKGGNLGICAGEDGLLMVDDQYAEMAQRIEAALESMDSGELVYLLNTHFHGDHTGGNAYFGERAREVIAHENVRTRLSQPGPQAPAMPAAGLPDITYDRSMTIFFNGEEIRLRHFAGCHTDGDTVVYFLDSNVVHLGDLFFHGAFPYVDLASGGNVENLVQAIEQLVDELADDVKIIPGHGPLAGKPELAAYLATLKDTIAIVQERKSAGKTLEEAKQAGLPERFAAHGKGFISTPRWIDIVYNSLP